MTVKRARELGVWLTAGGVAVVPYAFAMSIKAAKVACYKYPGGGYHGMLRRENLRRPVSEEARLIREPGARAFPKKRRGPSIAWRR